MSQVVPTYGFKWISKIQGFTTKRTAKLVKNRKHGDILKRDVHYPEELHDMHNKLPDMVEMMNINKVKKVHIWDLDQDLKRGLMLKKMHSAIKFE